MNVEPSTEEELLEAMHRDPLPLALDEASIHEQVAAILEKLGVGTREELVTLFRPPDGHGV